VRAEAGQLTDPAARSAWYFATHLTEGRLEEARHEIESTAPLMRGMNALCLSVAWRNANKDAEARAPLEQAITLLAAGSSEQQIVAGWLREPPADLTTLLTKLTDLSLEPDDKVIVLLALASNDRPGREQLIELASRLGAWPSGREVFVNAMLSAMRK
jgi:hypothetical protein